MPAGDLYISPRFTIPAEELEFSQARSSGPGGQNVNKVNSKVILRWSLDKNEKWEPQWRRRFVTRYANRITREGDLVLQSDRFRDHARNLADVRSRLAEMLLECQNPPTPRKATSPTLGSHRRRLEAKSQTAQKKAGRGRVGFDD